MTNEASFGFRHSSFIRISGFVIQVFATSVNHRCRHADLLDLARNVSLEANGNGGAVGAVERVVPRVGAPDARPVGGAAEAGGARWAEDGLHGALGAPDDRFAQRREGLLPARVADEPLPNRPRARSAAT